MVENTSSSANTDQAPLVPSLTMLACQISIPTMTTILQRDQHLDRCANLVTTKLHQKPCELVVLPELSTIDYSRETFEKLNELAESDRGASFDCWSAVAREHQCAVVYGFPRKVDNGFRISSAVVSANGELEGIYDKMHLAQFGDSMEKEYFSTAGRELLIFHVAGFRIAPIICYDIRFPELCRTLVVEHNVDIILHVGAYARDASFYSWHSFATTRAVENQCYLLSLNRAGMQFGESAFCLPWVDEKTKPMVFSKHKEDCRHLVMDKSSIDNARATYTFLGDRLDNYDLPVK